VHIVVNTPTSKSEAFLVLEDATVFRGRALGAIGTATGEVVFNTSMTGYQEILTDPSYKGQIVAMTYPLIGNYGVNDADTESRQPWVQGFVIRELSSLSSNWRSQEHLDHYLTRHHIVGITGIDTRALTKHLRSVGTLRGLISSQERNVDRLIEMACRIPSIVGQDLVREVTCQIPYIWPVEESGDTTTPRAELQRHVVILDCGVKMNIVRELYRSGCHVTIVPATTTADQIRSYEPDGIVLSNGPGDPEGVPYAIETAKHLLEDYPIFGICLGQQLLGLALGGRTYKLKFGHRGANHPVLDTRNHHVAITAHNHGFSVDLSSLQHNNDIELTHVSLYDRTVEGFRHKRLPVLAVQYHPEASPGPHDASYLFDEFATMMTGHAQTH